MINPTLEEIQNKRAHLRTDYASGNIGYARYAILSDALDAETYTTAKRETLREVRQKLREIKLLDYYCKCDDVGHVIAMPRAEYDTLITHLESELTV